MMPIQRKGKFHTIGVSQEAFHLRWVHPRRDKLTSLLRARLYSLLNLPGEPAQFLFALIELGVCIFELVC